MTFQRNLPPSAFKPKTLLAFGGLIMVYGWYHLFHGIREQRYLASTSHMLSLYLFPTPFPFSFPLPYTPDGSLNQLY